VSNAAADLLLGTIEKVEALRGLFGFGEWDDGWCRCSLVGEATAGHFDASTLQELSERGCRVELCVEADRLRVTAVAEGSRAFAIISNDEWAEVAEDDQAVTAATGATARNDLIAMLLAVPNVQFKLKISVLGKDLDHPWVRERRTLVREYQRIGWFEFAAMIAPASSGWNKIVIMDASDSFLVAGQIVIFGVRAELPEMSPLNEVRPTVSPGDCRCNSPLPSSLLPTLLFGSELEDVQLILGTIAGNLACVWLADSVSVESRGVTVKLQGNRPIQGLVPECPPAIATDSVKLWNWTAAESQPGQRHAVLQAITLQIDDLKDLYPRSGSILDTAQFLFSIAQSGLVQEALAARRAARDAALQAGNAAGDQARASARSAVDRVLVVIGAAIGIVFANEGGLIDRPVAFGLLGLAAALTTGALLMALHLDLPGAEASVVVFKNDLEIRTEVLMPGDIESIKRLPSLTKGLEDVARARRACFVIATSALLSIAITAAVVGMNTVMPANEKSPTTTVTMSGTHVDR
jgi:hypothetical protein